MRKKKKFKAKKSIASINLVAKSFTGEHGARSRTQVHKAANKYCRKRNKKELNKDCLVPFFIGE